MYYRRFNGNYYPRYDRISSSSDLCDFGVDCLSSLQNYSCWSTNSVIYMFNSGLDDQCSNYKIFGGNYFGKSDLIQANFYNLPIHTQVDVSFDLFKIDNWVNEEFRIWIDSFQSSIMIDNSGGVNLCGDSLYNEKFIHVSLSATSHTGPTLTINFQSFQSLSTGTYGIQNINIILTKPCDITCLTCDHLNSSLCITCPFFATLTISGFCQCRDKFYMNTTNFTHCEECDITCMTCVGPTTSNCTSCYDGDVLYEGQCYSCI